MPYVSSDGGSPRICVIMCGLPARGKSYMSQKIVRYLSWHDIPAKVFNIGEYRRKLMPHPPADFFSEHNIEGKKVRRESAELALHDAIEWFNDGTNCVAVYDGTNSTVERRKWLASELKQNNIHPLFIETVCTDENIIRQNVLDVKTESPDYMGTDPQKAVADFLERIKAYESVYQTISGSESMSYLKIINAGEQVVVNAIASYMESRIVYYMMNLHIRPRKLWLSRHGESEYNLSGKLGGDSNISPRGELYARKLPEMVANAVGDQPLTVWTSTLRRTQQTARFLPYPKIAWKALDELDAGVCDGLTYEDIKNEYPEDFKARDENKYYYRYRSGESYADIVTRLDPIIMELERQENILIVTHQAVLRCIYAYYMNIPQERSPWMEVPLHTLICLEPHAYGTKETRIKANIPAVSTFRAKGEAPGSLLDESVEKQLSELK